MANTRESLGDKATLAGLVGNTLTEFEEDSVPELRGYAFYGRTALQSVKMPGTTKIGEYCFNGCTGLTEIGENDFPDLVSTGQSAFGGCSNLRNVTLKKVKGIGYGAFGGCANLSHVEFLSETEMPAFEREAFNGAKELSEVIIRYVSENGPGSLSNTGIFYGTKLLVGDGAIYVPSSMVEKYRAATNWSAFRIESIDDYPLANFDSIQDSWAQIAAAEANGTYRSKYAVGDTKSVEFTVDGTTYKVKMKIMAMDEDTLSDESGNAKITWGATTLFVRAYFHSSGSANWESCSLRAWLNGNVLAALEAAFGSDIAIQSVKKKFYDYGTSSVKTCDDKVFVPSLGELKYSGSSYRANVEPDSPDYTGAFGGVERTDSSQTAYRMFLQDLKSGRYWLRTKPYGSTYLASGESLYTNTSGNTEGVLLCFCT